MSNPLHASNYADSALQQTVAILENVRLAQDTYRIRFQCPEMARRVLPGQFFMLRLAELNDPLIGRAFALYDTVCTDADEPVGIDIVYLAKGKFTGRLAQCSPGQQLVVWGPLGNGFPPSPARHLIMVAGGIGQTPFVALAQQYLGHKRFGTPPCEVDRSEKVTLCYGARTANLLAGIDDFVRVGVDVRVSTEDGSRGHHGLVTDVLRGVLGENQRPQRIVCCGPEPMLEAVAKIAAEYETRCQVSLETPMACGIGICFSCVAKVKDDHGDWDYKRTCVEGPVFDAEKIQW